MPETPAKVNPYHYFLATRLRSRLILKHYSSRDRGVMIDAGCGAGYITSLLGESGFIVGVDRDKASLTQAAHKGRFACADLSRLPFKNGSCDSLLSSEVLEHLTDEMPALREFRRVLKQGGEAFITVPCTEGALSRSPLRRAGHDLPGLEFHHRSGYSLKELTALLERAGLKVLGHRYCTGIFSELMVEWSKAAYLKGHKGFRSQSEGMRLARSPLWTLYVTLIFPLIYAFGILEDEVFNRLFKGHILMVRAQAI